MAVQTPFCGGIVEARPGTTDRDLIGVCVLHRLVEMIEILLTPVGAIGGPSAGTGLYPGIRSRKVIRELSRCFVFVNQHRRPVPRAAMLANAVPIDVPALRENKYHRLAVVSEVGVAVL